MKRLRMGSAFAETVGMMLALACVVTGPARAQNWEQLSGEALRDFVSGVRAEIQLRPGVVAVGEYHTDGTAEIEAWGETFPRTWEVRDNNQVCYSSATETQCYRLEQNRDAPDEYRALHVDTGDEIRFRVSRTQPRVLTRDTPPDEEGGPGAPSAEELAVELSNPNTSLGTMNFLYDYIAFEGDLPDASSQGAMRVTFQPGLPYPLSDSTNLFVRPAIPMILEQDVPVPGSGFESEGVDLGDISFDAALGHSFKNGLVLVGGVVGTLPTATEDRLGLDQWLLGPEFAVAAVRRWGVFGILLTQQWDVAGDDDFSTSVGGGQYFYAINLNKGWQLIGSPTFSYNHKSPSSDAWTVPIAIGASKTTLLKGRPWKFSLQYWHYLEAPRAFAPDYQIRFGASPVVKLPW